MKVIKTWIGEMDPEDKKDLIENIVAWGSLFGIAFMLSGICV